MILVNDFLIFFYLMQWLNSDKARKGRPKIQPLNPNPHTFANNKIITGGGLEKLQIVPTRDICEFWIFVRNSLFTFICFDLFFFIYILCVAGFHLSGTVKEPSNPLYSTDPDVPYQVSISFDR